MSSHSIAEAQERLPELIDRALRGEPVVITRDGAPLLEVRPVRVAPARAVTDHDIAWLRRLRVTPAKQPVLDAATLIRQMRDEGP